MSRFDIIKENSKKISDENLAEISGGYDYFMDESMKGAYCSVCNKGVAYTYGADDRKYHCMTCFNIVDPNVRAGMDDENVGPAQELM